MKKITKSDLKGLTEIFPVYSKEIMRAVIGGGDATYWWWNWMNNIQGDGYFGWSDFSNAWTEAGSSGGNNLSSGSNLASDWFYGTWIINGYGSDGYSSSYDSNYDSSGYGYDLSAPSSNNYSFKDDCFWRCVAYMTGNESSAEAAAELALEFFTWQMGDETTALSHLAYGGSGMSVERIQDYICTLVQSGNYQYNADGQYIGVFNTNNISCYESTGTSHAVIVESVNPDGSLNIKDIQQDFECTVPANEAQHVIRAVY